MRTEKWSAEELAHRFKEIEILDLEDGRGSVSEGEVLKVLTRASIRQVELLEDLYSLLVEESLQTRGR